MNINEIYGGDWLRAADLQGRWPAAVTIAGWEMVEFEDDRTGKMKKQVALSFVGRDKRLGLNKTNANRIADSHGPEVENWAGKSITLIVERVEAFGKLTDAIRVQIGQPGSARPQEQAVPPTQPAQAVAAGEDIPW